MEGNNKTYSITRTLQIGKDNTRENRVFHIYFNNQFTVYVFKSRFTCLWMNLSVPCNNQSQKININIDLNIYHDY